MMPPDYLKIIATWLPIFTIGSFIISIIALCIAMKNYRRKTGLFVRGNFSKTSSADSDDSYVSSVVLENLKDRAITIFSIYLRIGSNYYVVIEDFEDKTPLILKAFETYQKDYAVIQFYSSNMKRISLNSLFQNKKAKRRLILSTSEGRYVVPSSIPRWSPIGDFFKNHMTLIIHPHRLIHNGQSIGSNVKYVVDIIKNGNTETILLEPMDFNIKKFKKFQLTKTALESSKNLEDFFAEQKILGNVFYDNINIYDTVNLKVDKYSDYDNEIWEAEYYTSLYYLSFGRFFTWRRNVNLRKENKNRALQYKKQCADETQDNISDIETKDHDH